MRILLQTTIPPTPDDWSIERFSMLHGVLVSDGHEVTSLADYNWDTRAGAPSFVSDPPSDDVVCDPDRLEDIQTYVRNAALWLSAR